MMPDRNYFAWADEAFDRRAIFDKPEALRGIRVVELSTLILGPATADYLGEFGAEVIKVELPGTGDTMRSVSPEAYYWRNLCLGFTPENHNKFHITLDVHHPEGSALFKQLVARADVLVENVRPGTMDAWRLGYRHLSEVNPRLIYLAASGFGQWGPFSVGRASYDILAQAASGMAYVGGFPGRPPLKVGIYLGDFFGATMNAIAILTALHHRNRTGKGQYIEYSQAEGLIRTLDWTWLFQHLTGQERERTGNRDVAVAPSDIFRCKDGFVAIAAATDAEFAGLCKAMGRPGLAMDKRFATLEARLVPGHNEALCALIGRWTAAKTKKAMDAAGTRFGFAAAPVMDAKDHHGDPHLRARGSVWELDDPLYGSMTEYGPAPKLSATPGRMKWAAKPVGWHNAYVFRRILGLPEEAIRDLEDKKIIGRWADRVGAKPPDDWRPPEGAFF
ncbi:MAG: CoA transferase [candidate division NC10 bacterium]|nr:CoA transferase [candidate division NC10 bacterium]